MFDELLPHNDVAIRILKATDALMAQHGVQYLSTHKIAKEAGVSVGTIYLYFKDKDELLNQLVLQLFSEFHHYLENNIDPALPLFEQYCQLWRTTWQFLQENPRVVQNMHQYEALPTFRPMILRCQSSGNLAWAHFFQLGQEKGVIAPLPIYALSAMSVHSIFELMHQCLLSNETVPESVLNEMISRTWKAISV